MRRTKIIATIGPASDKPEVAVRLVEAGVNVFRLNFSHGTQEEHQKRIETLREAARQVGRPVAIMIDLKGPEIRIGTFADGKIMLKEGDTFTVTTQEMVGII
jgi:pyruvate kinase